MNLDISMYILQYGMNVVNLNIESATVYCKHMLRFRSYNASGP